VTYPLERVLVLTFALGMEEYLLLLSFGQRSTHHRLSKIYVGTKGVWINYRLGFTIGKCCISGPDGGLQCIVLLDLRPRTLT
jgi:hypothetical protein